MRARIWIVEVVLAAVVVAAAPVRAATITDSTTFVGFSVTYDAAVWGTLKHAHEADAFGGPVPVVQYGFGRFFFDPGFRLSSDGSRGPSQLSVSGQIVVTAKHGYGLYYANVAQSGQWTTTGSGSVSVADSLFDIHAAGGSFFHNDQRAYTGILSQGTDQANGYYYILNERSSFSRFGELVIDYDIELAALAGTAGFAQLASDVSDPSYLFGPGPYPGSNIVGTFLSIHYERFAPVAEPPLPALLLAGLLAIGFARRPRHTGG
jgi:hypothetical protein